MADYKKLAVANDGLQQSLIRETLTELGIPFHAREPNIPTAVFGGAPLGAGIGWMEFLVPEDQLQEAKDNLCAAGIVCDVSERLLKRTIAEIVEPLLDGTTTDRDRLLHAISINNKETVRALFDIVASREGGVALLEDTFFDLAADGAARLRDLARVLAREEPGRETEFARRLATAAIDGDVDTRLSILGVLSLFARWGIPWPILQPALADTDADIRDAASEVLFELEIDDCGYEPDASEAERRDAINTIESGLRGEGRL